MLKKAIHHVNRTVVVCLEIAGIVALLLFLGWVGLIWRLSEGPLNVSPYFTKKLETAFEGQLPEFDFKVGAAQLIWGGRFQPFEIEIKNLQIERLEGTAVLGVKKLRVQLSKRNLAFGRIVPRIVKIFGPTLQVIRLEDGRFTLNVGDDEEAGKSAPPPDNKDAPPGNEPPPDGKNLPAPVSESREQLVKSFLEQLQEREGLGILDGLQQIEVTDAAVVYEDRILNVSWKSTGADITATRDTHGIVASLIAGLSMGGGQKSSIKADIAYDWTLKKTTALVGFGGFVPAEVAQQSEQLKDFSGIDMPVTGSIGLDLDADFRPVGTQFSLLADAGTFNAFELYDRPIPVKSLFLRGKADAATGVAVIDKFKLDLGGPVMEAGLKVEMHGGARDIAFTGVLLGMPVDSLDTYWPALLNPEARGWVTRHLSKGTATRATLDLGLLYDPAAEHHVTVRQIGGKIDFTGISVDYFPPLPPVTGAAGSATYDPDSFILDVTAGKLLDMTLQKSSIRLLDLDKSAHPGQARIEIENDLAGPLKTALRVLDSEPLKYPEKLGLKSAEIDGSAKLKLGFRFPLHNGLTLHDVAVTADATLKDVLLKNVVAGMDLTGGPFDLHITNDALKAEGRAQLAGMPVDFKWLKNFSSGAPVSTQLEASLPLDAAALKKFQVPDDFNFSGTMPAKITYRLAPDQTAKLSLQGDLKPAAFDVPLTGAGKKIGAEGSIAFDAALAGGKLQRLSGLSVKSAVFSAQGNIDFDGGSLKKVALSNVSTGSTSVALNAAGDGKGGYNVALSGRQLDASSLFNGRDDKNNDIDAAKPVTPLRLTLDIAHILTTKDRSLEKVKATLVRNRWQRIDMLDLGALAGGKNLSVRYLPEQNGHSLKVEAGNAGAALAALGITKSVRGGRLIVTAKPRASGPRDLGGVAILEDFKLNDAPTVATLLNSMSLGGLIDLLNGEGLNFKKARVTFGWIDRGQPGQQQNVRQLTLKDGQTSGSSLGLSFEGNIDNWKNTYDLQGTIVPVSNINKFLNIIPILGTVLTAGGEGVIAATYTITGPKDKPRVMVNPLSVLAPGILRKIFFEH